jgi:hypothetical protein
MSKFEESFQRALRAAAPGATHQGKPAWWTEQHDQAYSALQAAGERIGAAEYAAGRYKARRGRTGKVTQGYTISSEHKQVVDALNDLGRNRISPEQAMAILHEYDVLKARTSVPRQDPDWGKAHGFPGPDFRTSPRGLEISRARPGECTRPECSLPRGHKSNHDTLATHTFHGFRVGDHVAVTAGREKGLRGYVRGLRSGPGRDKVSVALDHPVQAMLGPAILDPAHLRHNPGTAPRFSVLYYRSSGTIDSLQGPTDRFATANDAAKDIRHNFDSRFYDEAHITEVASGRPIATIHRIDRARSRWFVGRRPATLARYFD